MLRFIILLCIVFLVARKSFSDATFDKLFNAGKYEEAIEYADQKIPPTSRDAAMWVKIAKANEKSGLIEKALASYMVSWRMNPNDYASLLGAARIYNKLEQYDNGLNMAKKALEQKFTGEASWQYAKACIKLNKPVEAKKALEKVIETDPSNIVANRELGIIYFADKQYGQAIPLLIKAYDKKATAQVAYKIGTCYLKTNNIDPAIEYIKKALDRKSSMHQARLELARAYYKKKKYNNAASEYEKVSGRVTFKAKDYYAQAKSFEKTGKKNEAISAYRSAISSYGSSRDKPALLSRYKVGVADLKKKRYMAAISQLKFLADADPKAKTYEDIYFRLADAYLGANSSSSAIQSLEKAIRLDATNIEAYARLADLYTKSNMSEKARATYEKMMSLSPNDPNVYLVLGEYNLKAKKYSKALNLFVQSSSLKKSAAALEGIALSASAINQWEKARDAAESAVNMEPSRIKSRKVLAEALMIAKSYGEVKEHLEVLAKKEPSNKKYWVQLAECYDKLRETDKLARADAKIIALDRGNTTSRMRHAKYNLKKGDKDKAYKLFRELSVLKPKDPTVFKNLYKLALDKKDKRNAVTYLRDYLKLNPNDAESQKLLGDLYYEKKNLDGALVAYRRALKIDPGIKGFYKRYADIVIKKGQQNEVIKVLSGVINAGEADFGTYTTLGMIYKGKGVYKKAMDMYQQALMIDPRNTDALTALAECQAKLGNISDAVITYEQSVMLNPKADEEYKALGQLYMKQNKEDQAIKAYKNYLKKVPGDQQVAKEVGDYYYLKKKYKTAVNYLSSVKGNPANQFPHQLKLCESYYYSKDYQNTIIYTDILLKRKPKVDTKKDILKMQAKAYDETKQEGKALLAYDEYCKIPGVRDAEIAYKRAYLREKANPPLAQKIYKENIRFYPTDSRNYLQLGLIYSKNKATLSQAAPMLEKAAATAGKDKSLWLKIAKIYGKLGKEDKELSAYQKYIDADPQNLDANIRIGTILMKKGKVTEGMVYLETANTFSPGNVEVMTVLAEGYLKTNRPKEAIGLLEKAKNKKPNDVQVRKNLFDAYSKVGDKRSAISVVKEILGLKRDNTLLFLYAKMLYEEEKYKDAEDAIEDIMATNPENIEALMLLAKIQRGRKKYNDAIETYKEVIYIDAGYAPALYERAETYMEQNKIQWAERFYDRALRANPKYALAVLGKAKLAKMRKDDAAYKQHLRKAKQLDPNDPQIKAECKKARIY